MSAVVTDADMAAAHGICWHACALALEFARGHGYHCVQVARAIADAREAGERAGEKWERWACGAIVHTSADIGEAAERIKARRGP